MIKQKNKTKKAKVVRKQKDSPRRLLFAKYYLNETIDGKKNSCFLIAIKAAIKAGYAKSYAKSILFEIDRQNKDLRSKDKSPVVKNLEETRKSLTSSLQEKGINAEWITEKLEALGNSKKQGTHFGKFFDSDQPDSHAVRVALEFIAKTQGLYYAEETHPNDPHNLNGKSKEELIEIIAGRTGTKSGSDDGTKGKG